MARGSELVKPRYISPEITPEDGSSECCKGRQKRTPQIPINYSGSLGHCSKACDLEVVERAVRKQV